MRELDHSPTTVRDTPKSDTQPPSSQTNMQSKTSDTPPTSTQTNIQCKNSEARSDYFWGPWYDYADFHEDEQHATARMLSDDEIMLPLEEMKVLRRRLYNSQFYEAKIRNLTAESQRLTERLERAEAMIDRAVTHIEVLLDLVDKERAKSSRNE